MTDLEFADRYEQKRVLRKKTKGGTVYLALDVCLGKLVSIEVTDQHTSPEKFEQFQAEAILWAKLWHPHILPLFDVGQTDLGQVFIVSRFIDEVTLREKVGHESLSYDVSANMIATIAQTLDFIHQHGMLHLNLNLDSILFDNRNQVLYLTDFLRLDRLGNDEEGLFFGNIRYTTPEQDRGELHSWDRRSDIFSLGVIFYELLTGKQPFEVNEVDFLNDIFPDNPDSPRSLKADVPIKLERICLKALSKRPGDRYSTAAELANELLNWQTPSKSWWPNFRNWRWSK